MVEEAKQNRSAEQIVADMQKKSSAKSTKKSSSPNGPIKTQIALLREDEDHSLNAPDHKRGLSSTEFKAAQIRQLKELAKADQLGISEIPDEEIRRQPNTYVRSGLFAASKPDKQKKHSGEQGLIHVNSPWGKIIKSVPLHREHKDMLHAIRDVGDSRIRLTYDPKIHALPESWPDEVKNAIMAREEDIIPGEDIVIFSGIDIIKRIPYFHSNSTYYKRIDEGLDALTLAQYREVKTITDDNGVAREAKNKPKDIVKIYSIGSDTGGTHMAIFSPGFLKEIRENGSFFDFKTIMALSSDLAKNLYEFLYSHVDPKGMLFLIEMDNWDQILGYYEESKERLADYRTAVAELVAEGHIHSAAFINPRAREYSDEKKMLAIYLTESLWDGHQDYLKDKKKQIINQENFIDFLPKKKKKKFQG